MTSKPKKIEIINITCCNQTNINNIPNINIYVNKTDERKDNKILAEFVKKMFDQYMHNTIYDKNKIKEGLQIQRYWPNINVDVRVQPGLSFYKLKIKGIKENETIEFVCTSTQTVNMLMNMVRKAGYINGELSYKNAKLDKNLQLKDCGFDEYNFNELSYERNINKSKKIPEINNDENQNKLSRINIDQVSNIKSKKNTKTKKKSIPHRIKIMTWDEYIGKELGIAKCTCCKTAEISKGEFHCGHVISESNGGQICVDNLRPICAQCNLSMGTRNMDEFIREYKL